jgi:hypothetical protein
MKLPKYVKIHGQKYGINNTWVSDDKLGETHSDTNQINIVSGLSNDKLLQVLLHEMTHALLAESPLIYRKRFNEEEVADIVGAQVLGALKDNPFILRYILKEIEYENTKQ